MRKTERKITGITISIDGDTQPIEKAFGRVNKQSGELQSELKKVERLLKLDPTNTDLLRQRQEILAAAISTTKDKLDKLKEAEKQAQDQLKDGKIGEDQYRALQREIVATEGKLKSLENQAAKSNSKLNEIAEATRKFGKSATDAGKAMMPASVAIAGVGGIAAKAAIDFESSFAGVIKTVDATEEELANLKDGIRDMAKEIPTSANEIAGLAEAAGQLGIETPNILEFTRTMADLGVATNLAGEEAASSLAKFANITQMPQTEFDRLGSTIVALGNNLATTEADIVSMGMRLAGAGKQVGMSEAQILSFSGALSSVGIEAEAGGSAFSKVMVEMQLAAETGGAKLNDFAAVAGMTADEFAVKFKTDAAGALTDFISGLGNAEQQGVSAIKVLDDMGISEVRMRDALLRASGAGDLFTESIKLGTQAWEENTALTKEAEQRYNTSASKIEMAKNAVADLGITVGEVVVPVLMSLIERLSTVVEWFANLSPETQKTIITIAGLIAIIGPLLMIIGQASLGISALAGGLGVLKTFLLGTGESVGFLSKAMTFLSANPIGLVIAAVAALVAAFIYFWNTSEEFRNFFIGMWENIQSALQAFDEWLGGVFATDWTEHFGIFGNILNAFFQNVSNIWNAVKMIFTGVIDFVKNVFTGNWQGAWESVINIFKGIFELLVSYAKAPLNAVIGMLNAAVDGINLLIKGLNKINFDIPDWVPGLGGKSFGINIPLIGKIPMLAKGGVLSSGNAIVGEAGPELLSMIAGRAVVTPLTSGGNPSGPGAHGATIHQTNNFNGNYKPRDGAAAVRDLNRQLGRVYK